ncbi:MAG: DNA polymerase/3'-5' exonuclease PolX [Phycisphaerae bacterium]|nr:DNA polymerase/3'-5' exonuclease PolX [Phycisphaerae bacterium]
MTNADVAQVFNEVATLLEIKGADGFRVSSYRRVARTISELATDINELAARRELHTLEGVGKSSVAKIEELLETGRLSLREELLAEVPESVLRLLAVPNIGPKKAALLWREAGIESLGDLKTALQAGKLSSLKGFGPKMVTKMLRGIEFIERSAGRTRLGMAWKISTLLGGAVLAMKGVERAEFAGSLRRGRETVGDLDMLCAANDPQRIIRRFVQLQHVTQVITASGNKALVLVDYQPFGSLRVELRVVPAESFGAAWRYYTGSKRHDARMRERAAERGWTLSEHGLFEGDRLIAAQTEEEIYAALDLPWIPPELREDRGEFELKKVPRDLIIERHLRGDLHIHTVASDGRNTVEEMALAAKERGYEYICITEHSQSSAIAGGLKESVLHGHIKDVRAVAERMEDITVWMGTEVDILPDGRLDYPDELLAELDFVIASIHSGMGTDIEANTRRTLTAMQNPYVNCIGHPTGRLINQREAMPIDIAAIAKEAARTGTAMEINSNNYRLDLKDEHVRLARDLGAKILINTDAHGVDQFEQIRFGVMTARRGWLRKGDVLNTRPENSIALFVAAKRQGR